MNVLIPKGLIPVVIRIESVILVFMFATVILARSHSEKSKTKRPASYIYHKETPAAAPELQTPRSGVPAERARAQKTPLSVGTSLHDVSGQTPHSGVSTGHTPQAPENVDGFSRPSSAASAPPTPCNGVATGSAAAVAPQAPYTSAPPTPWNGVATRLPAAPPRPPRLGGEPSASALALHPSTRIIMPTDIPTPDLLTMQRAIEAVEGGADAWNGPHYGKAQITCVVVRDWLKETRGIGFADEPYLRLMAEGHYDEIVFWHLTRLAAHHKLRARCATPRDLLEAIAAAWNRGVTGYLASPLAAQDYAARVANMYEHLLVTPSPSR